MFGMTSGFTFDSESKCLFDMILDINHLYLCSYTTNATLHILHYISGHWVVSIYTYTASQAL